MSASDKEFEELRVAYDCANERLRVALANGDLVEARTLVAELKNLLETLFVRARYVAAGKKPDSSRRAELSAVFGGRIGNALARAGIMSVDEVQACSAEDLLAIPNIGEKGLVEIRERLADIVSAPAHE